MTTASERIKAKHLPSRVAGRRSRNLVGAIEGTIVATAVAAGLDESDASSLSALWIILATGTFFWVAHVYADLLAGRIQGHHRMRWVDVTGVMSREWPLLQSSFVLAVPLALGSIGVLADAVALDVAWLVGIAALVGWGVLFARREGHGPAGVVAAAAVNAAVGLVIIGFKVAVK